jgi:hypothetical protein
MSTHPKGDLPVNARIAACLRAHLAVTLRRPIFTLPPRLRPARRGGVDRRVLGRNRHAEIGPRAIFDRAVHRGEVGQVASRVPANGWELHRVLELISSSRRHPLCRRSQWSRARVRTQTRQARRACFPSAASRGRANSLKRRAARDRNPSVAFHARGCGLASNSGRARLSRFQAAGRLRRIRRTCLSC